MRSLSFSTRSILSIVLLSLHVLPTASANVLVNDNAGASATNGFTQSGASTIVFGSTVVVLFADSGSAGGSPTQFSGRARSIDGGQTFTDLGKLPNDPLGDAAYGHMARHDGSETLYATALPSEGGGLLVYRSFDDGVTFAPAVNATPAIELASWNAIATDNFAGFGNGILYVAVESLFGSFRQVWFYRSGTGGVTWVNPVLLSSSVGNNCGRPQIVVAPDHRVVVAFVDFATNRILIRSSLDRGVTFGPASVAATLASGEQTLLTGVRHGTATSGSFRALIDPRLAANPVTGQLYLVYFDDPVGDDRGDIHLKVSNDGGATWGDALRVNADPGTNDQWQPTLAVTPDGRFLGVFWYDRRHDSENNRIEYFGRQCNVESETVSCGGEQIISDTSFLPEFGRDGRVNAIYAGDYDDASATNDFFHVSWGDNRLDLVGGEPRKDPNVFHRAVAVPEPGRIEMLCASLLAIRWVHRRQFATGLDGHRAEDDPSRRRARWATRRGGRAGVAEPLASRRAARSGRSASRRASSSGAWAWRSGAIRTSSRHA